MKQCLLYYVLSLLGILLRWEAAAQNSETILLGGIRLTQDSVFADHSRFLIYKQTDSTLLKRQDVRYIEVLISDSSQAFQTTVARFFIIPNSQFFYIVDGMRWERFGCDYWEMCRDSSKNHIEDELTDFYIRQTDTIRSAFTWQGFRISESYSWPPFFEKRVTCPCVQGKDFKTLQAEGWLLLSLQRLSDLDTGGYILYAGYNGRTHQLMIYLIEDRRMWLFCSDIPVPAE